jgi:uncharacterized protein with ATP-grasp and redox domains
MKRISSDPISHEILIREVPQWTSEIDLDSPPPVLSQRIHGRLREEFGFEDPYRLEKIAQNRRVLSLLPEWRAKLDAAPDPLALAVRLAIAGNGVDLGSHKQAGGPGLRRSIQQALSEPLMGDQEALRREVEGARSILYLADNAGEIILDRLLIERLGPERVTVAVRGAPVLNDATFADARTAGLDNLVEVVENGSDAPGTVIEDCSESFLRHLAEADLILAKGQGNYITLGHETSNVFFLFKAKCRVMAEHAGVPLGAQVLARPHPGTVGALGPPTRQDS